MTQERVPAADKTDYERALEGLDFPLSKVALVRAIHDRGGIDHEVLTMVERLPQDEYEDLGSLVADIRAEYAAEGFPSAPL